MEFEAGVARYTESHFFVQKFRNEKKDFDKVNIFWVCNDGLNLTALVSSLANILPSEKFKMGIKTINEEVIS